jgi:type II secretory pathway component PulK
MRYPIRTSGRGSRRGIALIAVLVVIAVLALAAYHFSDLMVNEAQAADSYTRSVQARGAADSGVNYFAALLASDPTWQNGYPYDNSSKFQGIQLGDAKDSRQNVRFSIVSPLDPDTAQSGGSNNSFRYGVIDESGKININALMKLDSSGQTLYNTLMQLPNMTDDVANSIVFWVDSSATQRSSGATDEYYSSLNPPYHAKNAPLDSIEELLYVRGVTPQLLFGNDTKRNGQLDPNAGDGTGTLDQGWFPFLTMYSREMNVDSTGNPRTWVNDPNLQALASDLTNAGFDDAMAAFIIAYRMYGAANSSSGNGGSGGGGGGNSGGGSTPMGGGSTPMGGGSSPAGGGAMGNAPKGGGGAMGGGGAASGGAAGGGAAGVGGKTVVNSMTADGKTTTTTVAKPSASPMGGGSSSPMGGGGGTNSGANVSTQPLTTTALGDLSSARAKTNISSLYVLVNAQVTIPAQSPQDKPTTYNSPMSDTGTIKQYLPQLLDKLTTSKSPNLPARVNVNTAPNAVLSALTSGSGSGTPLLDAGTVQTILSTRPSLDSNTGADNTIFQTPAWLITEAGLPVSTVQSLDQYITARSQVYRLQALGHFEGGGPTARVEAVVDLNGGRPRIVYYRDLTALGKGFDLPKN